jgi:Fms-interacting protein/Thoc5
MGPLKKRAKMETTGVRSSTRTGTSTGTSNSISISTSTVLELTCQTVDDVFDAVAKDPDNEDQWIAVATLQQRMLQKIRQQEEELKAFRERKFKQQQEELATQYERDYLQSQIEEYRTFPLPNLEQLAREECRKDEQSFNITEGVSREDILHKFLQVDINDPNQKDAVTLKLQKCFEHRAALGKKVQVKRQALKAVQLELKAQQDFLTSLPMHIQTLERASQSLVKFMQKNGLMHPQSGNERLQRLRRAKTLPPPMYTLFALFQHAIDERPGVSIKIAHNDQVVLQFPLPDVLANSKKPRQNLSIAFSYDDGQVKVETAVCTSLINHEFLLEELFEGDTSAAAVTTGTYGWANQLAGLHPVAVATVASTGLVLHEIERRIHAYAVLHFSLSELLRGKVPTPPGTEALSKTSATFTRAPDNAVGGGDVYNVGIENSVVDVKVNIPRCRYPANPPIWSIPLDKNMENRLNVELLQNVSEDAGPWILIHQVRAMLDYVGSEKVAAVRARKGRNRKIG